MLEKVIGFFESPVPYLVNAGLILAFLMAKKKAYKNASHDCRCLDARLGGGNLLGGAATLSFGLPPLILFLIFGSKFFLTLFLIQVAYSAFAFVTVVWPKLYKQGSVRIESHAGGNVSLCGMVAALNIGPLYWLSMVPALKKIVGFIVDMITFIHHYFATAILWVISFGAITTGWSKHK